MLVTLLTGTLFVHGTSVENELPAPVSLQEDISLQVQDEVDLATDPRRRLEQCWFEAYHGLWCWVWEIGRKCERGGKVYECKWWWYNRWEEHWDNSWYRRLDDGTDEHSVPPEGAIGHKPSDEELASLKAMRLKSESEYFEHLGRAPTNEEMKHLVEEREHAQEESETTAVAETDSEDRRRLEQCWFEAYHGLICWIWEIGRKCERGGKVYECKWWWYNRWEDHWDNSWYRRLEDGSSQDVSVEDCLSECFGSSEGKTTKECHDLCV